MVSKTWYESNILVMVNDGLIKYTTGSWGALIALSKIQCELSLYNKIQ